MPTTAGLGGEGGGGTVTNYKVIFVHFKVYRGVL